MSQAPAARSSSTAETLPVQDRRKDPRFLLKLAITLRGDNNFYAGVTSDISEGGVFIATQYMLPIGTPVVLEFHLPRFDVTLKLRGIVRWHRDPEACTVRSAAVFGCAYEDGVLPGMGVQFDGIGGQEAAMIRAFMRVRTPELFD